MRSRLPMMVLAVSLVAAACSATTSAPEDAVETGAEPNPTSTDNSTDDQEAADNADAATASEPGSLSVDEAYELLFPNFDPADSADIEARFAEEERERQTLITECMAAQGFEYQPVDYGQNFFFGPGNDLDPTSREFVEKYGFGFSTYEEEFAVEEEAAFESEEAAGAFSDPNQEYVDGLSESAREAYYAALYGDQPEFDPSFTEEEMEEAFEENPELFGPQGCEGEAYTETQGGQQAVYVALQDEMQDLFERMQADPRIAAWEQDWAACMADAGYTFTKMEEIYEELERRMNTIYESQDPGAAVTEEEVEAMTPEEREAFFEESQPEPDRALLDEVQAFEVEVALASFDCGGMDQNDLFTEIAGDYQRDFIEENLSTIAGLVDQDGAGG